MIRYSKEFWGLYTLARWYGSAAPRALPFALLSALLAGLLQGFWRDTLRTQWVRHHNVCFISKVVQRICIERCARDCDQPYVGCALHWSLFRAQNLSRARLLCSSCEQT